MIIRKVVVLPAPLRPSRPTMLRWLDRDRDLVDHGPAGVAFHQIPCFQQRHTNHIHTSRLGCQGIIRQVVDRFKAVLTGLRPRTSRKFWNLPDFSAIYEGPRLGREPQGHWIGLVMFAILSDIHSNVEALTTVLADIAKRGIQTIYCLGDVIGYGPNPGSAWI